MASITLNQVKKVYKNGFEALHGLDLEVRDGEFMVLVGPSGCGKTTALRLVAGLEEITGGTITVGDRVMNDVPASERDIAMVFQNYALYPHMTVAQNMGFALKLQRTSKSEIAERVSDAARILGLTEWLDRKPGQLSGGQRQRVAMGRAITRAPAVFLMDEPLSNLDAKLRTQMRAEVLRIQRRLGVGTLYVTHDQTEAMTMGDRVAVMRNGSLQQCDTPERLFFRPTNMFVAAFIGSPSMNLFEVELATDVRSMKLGSQTVGLPEAVVASNIALSSYAGRRLVLGVRPEDLSPVTAQSSGALSFGGRIDLVEPIGSELLVHFQIDARRVVAEGARAADEEGLDSTDLDVSGEGVAEIDHRFRPRAGEQLTLQITGDRMYFFDPDSGAAIRPETDDPGTGRSELPDAGRPMTAA